MRSPDGEIGPDEDRGPNPPRPRPRPRPVGDFGTEPGLPRPRPVNDFESETAAEPGPPRPRTPALEPEAGDGAEPEKPRRRTAVAEPGTSDGAEPETLEPEAKATSRAGERKAGVLLRRRRTRRASAAVLAVLALFALFLVPEVRTVLRQSFTRLPQESTAIYFTENPRIQGAVLEVPLTVEGVNTGVHTYGVKVWTENASGRVDASTTARIATAHGVTAAVVTLPIADDAAEVWASLDGTTQVLHFRISDD